MPKKTKSRSALFIILLLIITASLATGIYRVIKIPATSTIPTPEPNLPEDYDPKILTVGVDSRPASMLFYAVNHYIPPDRFQLRPVIIEDPNRRWMMMSAGELDLAFSTLPEFVLGIARHSPGKAVAFISSSTGADGIVTKIPLTNPDGLLGRKICAVPGSAGHYFLVQVLNSRGRSTGEVEFIPSPDNETALEYFLWSDETDAVVLWGEPFQRARKNHRLLISTDTFLPVPELLVAGEHVMAQRPGDLQLAVNGYYQLADFVKTNPGLARKLISSRSGKSIDQVDAMLAETRLYSLEEAQAISGEKMTGDMKVIQQIWSIEGLPNADNPIKPESTVNNVFMEGATVRPAIPLLDSPGPAGEKPSPAPSLSTVPVESPTSPAGVDPPSPREDFVGPEDLEGPVVILP